MSTLVKMINKRFDYNISTQTIWVDSNIDYTLGKTEIVMTTIYHYTCKT